MLEIKGAQIINGNRNERIRVHMEGFGTFIADDYEKLEAFRDIICNAAMYMLDRKNKFDYIDPRWGYYSGAAGKLLKLGNMLYDICREYREDHGYDY